MCCNPQNSITIWAYFQFRHELKVAEIPVITSSFLSQVSVILRSQYESTGKLMTEPPNSRVVVLLISTDSFGSGRELLNGWTPPARGVFTDDLNRARHELASAFENRISGAGLIAAGTDIIGGLWRAKTLLESGTPNGGEREIWIFSDMMNETSALPMPALIATGPDKMLERVKQNGLLVPLAGYRIHVFGASTRGLSPQAWNDIKTFWTQYWQAAGVESASYSEDSSPER